jgi:RNA polymerase sigma-70 factor (ECF subfamily)
MAPRRRGAIILPRTDAQAHTTSFVDEGALVAALRAGDEAAYVELLNSYGASMLRIAQLYVPTRAVAEEVVQEAWLGVLNGIGRFEGRSSLKTWLYTILTNRAKTRGEREGRTLPFSSLADIEDDGGLSVDPDRFLSSGRFEDHWSSPPRPLPEERLLASETREVVEQAIADLPPNQRVVISLRDVEGLDAHEACSVLGLSETNQRVLLHRARSKVRAALEEYLDETP